MVAFKPDVTSAVTTKIPSHFCHETIYRITILTDDVELSFVAGETVQIANVLRQNGVINWNKTNIATHGMF